MAIELQLIPIAELATGQAAAIRNGAISAVLQRAVPVLRVSQDKIIVRDIQPYSGGDLDFTYRTWYETTGASANVYETMTSGTISDRRFIGIYGIKDSAEYASVSKIRIKVGNSIKAIWQLEGLYSLNGGPRIGFSPSVVLIPPNTPYTIERFVLDASAPTQIVLKGFVVEAYGKVLSP